MQHPVEPSERGPDATRGPDGPQWPLDSGVRHGVVFVHGVGDQRESDTLIDFGEPLLDWLARWYADRGDPVPQVGRVELGFAPADIGLGDSLSRANLRVWNADARAWDRWVWAEAWWATSSRRPGFQGMLYWSLRYWWRAVVHVAFASVQRVQRLFKPRGESTDPNALARLVDLLNSLGLLVLYAVGALLGYVVLLPLLALAQVPLEPVRNFVLLRLLRPFLEINAGAFRTYIEDDLQAGNMRRRVADAVTTLVERDGCDDVTIIAHSEGAVVSFGMLVDATYRLPQAHVGKLITLGAGLNLTWTVEQKLARLHGPIPAHVHWLDLWGSYDPVPAGWLVPPRVGDDPRPRLLGVRLGRDRRCWAPIFRPTEELAARQQLRPKSADPNPYRRAVQGPPDPAYWPVSEQVTNEMNLLADHGGYWKNDEQVLTRLAAEIDRDYFQDSRFWRGDCEKGRRTEALRAGIRRRRVRVTWLALGRAVVILAWLAVCARFVGGLAPRLRDGQTDLPLVSDVQRLIQWLYAHAVSLPAPIPSVATWVDDWLYVVLAAVILGVPFLVLYALTVRAAWDRWDRRARADALGTIATACRPTGDETEPAAAPARQAGMPASATKVG